ncbi:NRDE family protein [Paraglaciecola sp.]|uniref:NRDE family protein n=1 Tax=Paraglaciecola sp. TaxID=1920173 RepID=UPI0030F3DA12
MCILFIAVNQHKHYPLIIAANRDEFFQRPTSTSAFWQASPNILAGIDQQAGGTWMGVNTQGHIAAITNIRAPQTIQNDVISRGMLVKHYLQQSDEFSVPEMQTTRNQYNGYNLLFGRWDKLQVYNNQRNELRDLETGVYGLSNASLNSPWPKVTKGIKDLNNYCQNGHAINDADLFTLLLDSSQAPDAQLPQTGVPLEWERRLSSIFIHGQDYGTRSSTILKINKKRQVSWSERTFNQDALCISEQNFTFDIN